MTIAVRTLRELFRNLQAWQSLYETDGIDTVTGPDGQVYCLHDIRYLYEQSQGTMMPRPGAKPVPVLSPRQSQAIRMFLYENTKETDVAIAMGVSITNPVASYATQGMVRLIELIETDQIRRFRPSCLQEAA